MTDWDREIDELRHAERHGLIDDPGPARCPCGWPLVPCPSGDGLIPTLNYPSPTRESLKSGDPCVREQRQAGRAA